MVPSNVEPDRLVTLTRLPSVNFDQSVERELGGGEGEVEGGVVEVEDDEDDEDEEDEEEEDEAVEDEEEFETEVGEEDAASVVAAGGDAGTRLFFFVPEAPPDLCFELMCLS